jgi:octanoyl-[GcvH]:protein N-octanoyltransferase
MELLRARHPRDPLLDAAITHALLKQVASGEKPPTARIFRPGPTMAFGRLDALDDARYTTARAASRAHGYEPILRLGGGHAAGYDEGSVLVEIIRPNETIADGIPERFASMTALLMESLTTLGITARTGELPGEYCAGDWSVNAAGVKLAGTAQRSIRGASLVTAMLIIENGPKLQSALIDIYEALSIDWRPATAASANAIIRSLTTADAERILISTLANHENLTATTLDDSTVTLAEQLRPAHAA